MACNIFTKNKERTKKLKKTGYSSYIYQRELDKAWFQHDLVYGDYNELPRRRASDKVLCNKAFNIANNPKYDGCQCGLASMIHKFFDKKSAAMHVNKSAGTNTSGDAVKSEIISKQQLREELHKPNIEKIAKARRILIFYRQYLRC